jgi:hypothetical protein
MQTFFRVDFIILLNFGYFNEDEQINSFFS